MSTEAAVMSMVGLAGRYATALFDLARDAGAIDAVGPSLDTLESALAGSADLRMLVNSPLIGRIDAGKATAAVAAELALHPLVGNILGVLARNGRLSQLGSVIRGFRMAAAASRGELTAQVTSARALSADQLDALRANLQTRTGRAMSLDVRVDPDILAGLVVRIGSEQIDSSLKTRLERLGQAMKG